MLLPLLRGELSLETALASNDDMLLEISYPRKQKAFFDHLYNHRNDIEDIVRFHLGLHRNATCSIGQVNEWMCGNFNICIPVYLNSLISIKKQRLLIRIPLPYKLGEQENEGNIEEKLRCEAASHIWINEKCPLIPIPYLWGFGFPNGQCFTPVKSMSQPYRLFRYLKCVALKFLGYPSPCAYVKGQYQTNLNVGYLIMDYIEPSEGKLLSKYWTDKSHERERRMNFLRDLSRIMLSLAQFPFPKIGSLTIDDDGFIQLCNRPLTFRLQQLENKGIPTGISRTSTYFSTDAYLSDLLSCHDSRFKHQANSICNEADGKTQLSVLAAMRAILPHFVGDDHHRHGPFVFTLTDVHPNNVFVDENWRIKSIIDLEWACVKPINMVLPPVWLTGRKVDELPEGDYLDEYNKLLAEFFDCFQMEELHRVPKTPKTLCTQSMKDSWHSGSFWYFHAVDNPKVVQNLFFQHIEPKVSKNLRAARIHDESVIEVLPYKSWGDDDAHHLINSKIDDRNVYRAQVRRELGTWY